MNGVRAGQEVIAIGSALGVLQNTVTRGIVSAIRNAGGVMLIQTDAAINRGNSGGPLIDHTGRVIGITTLKVSANSESLGFAVAIDHAKSLIEGRPAEHIAAPPGASPNAALAGAFSSSPARRRKTPPASWRRCYSSARCRGLAQRADQLDDYWQRFHAHAGSMPCPTAAIARGSGSGTSPRRWTRARCRAWGTYNDVALIAKGFATSMTAADDAARGAGVYPGVRRDLRRKPNWTGAAGRAKNRLTIAD